MKKRLVVSVLLLLAGTLAYADDQVVQVNGKTVVLHDDFTWAYVQSSDGLQASGLQLTKSPAMDKVWKDPSGKFQISYQSSRWSETKPLNDNAVFSIKNATTTGWGSLIYDGLQIPLSAMEKVVVSNAKNIDPDAKLINTQECTVNGTPGELVTYTATTSGLGFTFLSFLANNASGTVQFVFFTSTSEFDKLRASFIEAIGGLQF